MLDRLGLDKDTCDHHVSMAQTYLHSIAEASLPRLRLMNYMMTLMVMVTMMTAVNQLGGGPC